MSFEVPKSGKTERPPAGNHLAVLVALIEMGEQWQDPFKPTDKGYWWPRDFYLWELIGEQIAGTGKNHLIGIDLNRSTGANSKLRAFVEARTGKPMGDDFNPKSELGQPCFLSVVVNKKGYPVVNGMAAVPKGFTLPAPTYPVTALTLEEFQAGESLPEWVPWLYGNPLGDHIRGCKQIGGPKPQPRKAAEPTAAATGTSNDPIPF